MRIFHCDHCGNAVYFENTGCVRCGRRLTYLPREARIAALEPAGEDLWQPCDSQDGSPYRLCPNYVQHEVCNSAVAEADGNSLCEFCLLTRTIPNLGLPGRLEAWRLLETAKRRLIYSLMAFQLPASPKSDTCPQGLAFDFVENAPETSPEDEPTLTGHAAGVITLNIAEADDLERERRRRELHEPYRTLLGHFRHESGHFYWNLLSGRTAFLDAFRKLFGDERENYASALERYYREAPPADWQSRHVSVYATAHPWEDWAETWAHYLHLTDALETASQCGLALQGPGTDQQLVRPQFLLSQANALSFADLTGQWLAVAHLLNNLSRGLGERDAYPFVLSEPVLNKLRFVHETCAREKEEACRTRQGSC